MNLKQWSQKHAAVLVVFIVILVASNFAVYRISGAKPMVVEPETSVGENQEPHSGDELPEKMELFVQILEKITQDYLEPVPLDRLLEGAIEGMLGVLGDPQTCYYSPKQLENFMIETTGLFSGIGARLASIDNETWILRLFPDSPAEKAGLSPGDRIISVEGIAIPGQDLQRTADLLRGPAGTTVRMVLERPGVEEPLEVVIRREEVKVETVFSSIKEPGIGYIQITDFERSTGESFIRQLEALETTDKFCRGLILDLRNNSGGLLEEALEVAGQLIPEGEITRLVNRREQVKDVHYSYAKSKPYPIVVLINEESASASEVIAGALQDRRAALLVGEKTYGKATVQTLEHHLAGGGALRLTVAKYLTPSGRDLHGKGLEPDYYLELPEAFKYYPEFFPGKLKEGDCGMEVKLLQQMLWELAYSQVTPTGYFDRDTAGALADFQSDCGLEASGLLDSLTCLKLRQAMERLFVQTDPQLNLAMDLLLNTVQIIPEGS